MVSKMILGLEERTHLDSSVREAATRALQTCVHPR